MGCFDFTYADNGSNIRGQKGYIYLPDSFCKRTGIKSPLPFVSTDEYGRFDIKLTPNAAPVTVDIYSMYALMLFLEQEPTVLQLPDTTMDSYLNRLTELRKHPDHYNNDIMVELEKFDDKLRLCGINYFFEHMKDAEHTVQIPALANQKAKTVSVEESFTGRIPLVITRKKLPYLQKHESFYDTVRRWGFVSASDPNQGWTPTKNRYVPWIYHN